MNFYSKIVVTLVLLSATTVFSQNNNVWSCELLKKYKVYLEQGTYFNQDFSYFDRRPKSRYATFKKAFKHFEENKGKTIVELGTTRSFVHGELPGCNSNDARYWTPNNPENWDWGAGAFTIVAGECLRHLNPLFYTVDLASEHIKRCKVMTSNFNNIIYVVSDSRSFLKTFAPKSIDLLYLDTGDMTPIEATAQLQLDEAQIIVGRDLISEKGIIVIDDVKNTTPQKFGEKSNLGKAKYSLPFLIEHGFEIVADEYQVLLKRK
jgi:hypothetical protein